MELIIKPTDKAAFGAMSFLDKNKKFDILGAIRHPNVLIELTIQYNEEMTMDIFLPWRYSVLFTDEFIDNMKSSSSDRTYLVVGRFEESRESSALRIE
jgi:hypothetical protein